MFRISALVTFFLSTVPAFALPNTQNLLTQPQASAPETLVCLNKTSFHLFSVRSDGSSYLVWFSDPSSVPTIETELGLPPSERFVTQVALRFDKSQCALSDSVFSCEAANTEIMLLTNAEDLMTAKYIRAKGEARLSHRMNGEQETKLNLKNNGKAAEERSMVYTENECLFR